jgi:hypothetical protein
MKYLALVIFLSFQASAMCQSDHERLNWLDLGLGGFSDDTYTGSTDSQGGVSLFLSINFFRPILSKTQGEKNYVYHGLEFRLINHFMTINESHLMHYYDFDLMYGLSFGKVLRFNFSGGIGLLKYDEEVVIYPSYPVTYAPYSEYEKHYTANFPLEAGITIAPLKGFGLGAGLFANLNGEKPINGIFFKLEFGKLR